MEFPVAALTFNLIERMQFLFDEIDKYVDMGFKKREIGFPDMQGPLNVSLRLVGDNKMLGLIARKNKAEVVNHILDVASDVYIEAYQILRKELNRSLVSNWSVSGCSYYYLRPEKWIEYILPVIKKCEVLGKGVRLHHCGEADAKKLETYAKYPWNDTEFGFGTDLKAARKIFVDPKLGPLNLSCRISPYRLLNQSPAQITKDLEWIIENIKGGPTSIGAIGVAYNTPRENIMAAYDVVNAYNKKKEKEVEDDDDW